jgi:hypothetical protein
MLYYPILNLIMSLIIAMILVIPIYYAISTLRKHDSKKRSTWKQVKGKTVLKGDDFVKRVQKLCLHRNYILLEISPTHAYIKERMSFSSGGVMYYIELSEPDTLTIWARGAIYKDMINNNCLTSLVNMFYA